MTNQIRRAGKTLGAFVLSAAVLTGCEVTNPGPVQDEFLALPASQQGLVNGAIRALAELNGFGNYTSKLFGREFIPSGQTGSHGFNVSEHGGHAAEGEHGTEWGDFVTARFITETAMTRFEEVDAPNSLRYQAALWNAVTYRTGAFFFCDEVVTPLPVANTELDQTPGSFQVGVSTYLQRAVDAATTAMSFAATTDEMDKARMIRAQAYVHQGNWGAAATDAAAVAMGAEIEQEHSGLEESLHLYGINGNNRKPWGSWSMDFTFYFDYYMETGDPRAEWFKDEVDPANEFAVASLSGFGPVPWSNSAHYGRYPDFQSQVSGLDVIGNSHVTVDGEAETLGDYGEMQLILAEARLVANDIPGAMGFINSVRTTYQSHLDLDNDGNRFPTVDAGDNLPAYDPVGMTMPVAWALLMRERKVEMMMEGRVMPDELRWIENGTAAASANLNAGGAQTYYDWTPAGVVVAGNGTGGMYAVGPDTELGYMDVPNWEDPNHPAHTPLFIAEPRSRCFDIASTERDRNPNVPEAASPGDRYFAGQSTWPPSWWP